ncbi:thioesterase family protein [Azorhizobium doebereinerae]|uniref:thioesterase family protein n=1 Tax=Azorhizobium doebereinerae TaxID=281091 RepID=UPI00041FD346|nr:thioesterase family protein [Azorhizobium doebereinerae]
MLDTTDFEPVFFAPFVSSTMAVERDWTDYNGHLNVAYYSLMFDRAFDEALALLGFGPHALARRNTSFFTVETHTRYLRELATGVPVRVTLRLVDYDDKRLHLFESLHHGTEGWVAATTEQIALHVDLDSRRARTMPDDVLERIAAMRAAHATLPPPDGIGRSVGMRARC